MFAWTKGYTPKPIQTLPEPKGEALVKHLHRHYSDRNIAEDLDAVRACCPTSADLAMVEMYAKARRSAPGFAPGSYSKSNHDAIPGSTLEAVYRAGTVQTECPQCNAYFVATDKRRKFCSGACSMAARNGSARQARKRQTTASKPQVRRLAPIAKSRAGVVLPTPKNTATQDALIAAP